jgi:hypothetical protein
MGTENGNLVFAVTLIDMVKRKTALQKKATPAGFFLQISARVFSKTPHFDLGR